MTSTKKVNTSPTSLDVASSVFASVISKDENLLWQSSAGASSYALAHMRAVMMGVAFFAFALLWSIMVQRMGSMPALNMVTWIFGAIGVGYSLVPLAAYVKGKWFVFYALTNQRLIIMELFPKQQSLSFPLGNVKRVVKHNVSFDQGTLLIDAPGARSKNPSRPHAGFYGVKHVANVQKSVETLKNPQAAMKRAEEEEKQAKLAKPTLAKPALAKPPSRFTPSTGNAGSTAQNSQTIH